MRKIKELHVCMPYHRESFVLGEKIKCIGEAPKFEGTVECITKNKGIFIIKLTDGSVIEKYGTEGLTVWYETEKNEKIMV